LAAGITWTSRTAKAPWAGRRGHTSVVDAAGAIYVIGGLLGISGIYYRDVWASTDGGVRPDSRPDYVGGRTTWGASTGVLRGTTQVLLGNYKAYYRRSSGVLRGSQE
jgi:hypothetical protein